MEPLHKDGNVSNWTFPNSIGKQTLDVEVESESIALALQARLPDLNRRRFLPVIERVLQEMAVEGRQIRLERLRIDLGPLPLDRFEEVAEKRLDRELRRALENALRELPEGSTPGLGRQTEEEARLQTLKIYLLRGTLPSWAARQASFSVDDLLLELVGSDPHGLAAVLRGVGRRPQALRRIVLQFDKPTLIRLIQVLEPRHDQLIISYLLELREIHRVQPVLPLSEERFSRMLWLLTFAYLTSDRGSHFNRKSFVKSLLTGLGESQGLKYAEILSELRLGLSKTEKKHPLHSSLPAVIRELALELERQTAALEARAGGGPPAEEELAPGEEQAGTKFEQADQAPRESEARADSAIESEIRRRAEAPGQPSIEEQAGDALAELELTLSKGLAPSDGPGLLRSLAPRGADARRLIQRLAVASEAGPRTVAERLLEFFPPHAVLAVLRPDLQAFVADLVKMAGGEQEPFTVNADRPPDAERAAWAAVLELLSSAKAGQPSREAVRRVVERAADAAGMRIAPRAESPAHRSAKPVDRVVQALLRLERYLETGRPPEAVPDEPKLADLLSFLRENDASATRRLIRTVARRHEPGLPLVIDRLLEAFGFQSVAAALAPGRYRLIEELVEILREAAAGAPTQLDRSAVGRIVEFAALERLLSQAHDRPELGALARAAASRAAQRVGLPPESLAESMCAAAVHASSPVKSALIQALAAKRAGLGVPPVARHQEDRLLDTFDFETLASALAPRRRRQIEEFVAIVSEAVLQAQSGLDRAAARRAAESAVLESLLAEPRSSAEAGELIRAAAAKTAHRIGVATEALAESIISAAESASSPMAPTLAQALKAARPSFPAPSDQQLRPAFARYDRAELIRYCLDHGALPWSALLRDPDLTVEDVLAALPGLPESLLRAVLHYERPEARLRAILRVARALSEDQLVQLIFHLMPSDTKADSPFRSALAAFAAEASDKPSFYARLTEAMLEQRTLDLEQFEAAGPIPAVEPVTPDDLSSWEAHALKSALASRLQSGDLGAADQPSVTELLQTLIARHPEDAKQFLRVLRTAPGRARERLALESVPLFDAVISLRSPLEADALRALERIFIAVSAGGADSEAKIRQALLHQAMRWRDDRPLAENFFEVTLRAVFEAPLSSEATGRLFKEADSSIAAGSFPAQYAEALTRAIAAVRRVDREPPRQQPDADAQPAARLSDSVLELLLGKERFGSEVEAAAEKEELLPVPSLEAAAEEGLPQSGQVSEDALEHALREMLDHRPEMLAPLVRQAVSQRRIRQLWVKTLPESALARLCHLLQPQRSRALLDAAEALAGAWLETAPAGRSPRSERAAFWQFLLEHLADLAGAAASTRRLAEAFFGFFGARVPSPDADSAERADLGAKMLERAGRRARAAGLTRLFAVLHRYRRALLSSWMGAAAPERAPAPAPTADKKPSEPRLHRRRRTPKIAFALGDEEEEEAPGEPIYIDNAGLVLTGPFLPHLFKQLDMLTVDERGRSRMRNQQTASRGAHLLQYLVDGRTSAPEPLLVLNKILCGMPTGAPVPREIEITETEREVCDKLLNSIIANWEIIKDSSPAALQETFLQREGRLIRSSDGWKLRVQRKTLDVLVDQIPWSISVVYHRWMSEAVHVTW